MNLSIIVAASENHCIGKDGDLPWRLSADLKRFKQLTMGHAIIMGRRTFESIGRLLPGRETIIVTRRPDYQFEGALIAGSLKHAIELAGDDPQPFVTGGAEIYHHALPVANTLYLTRVLTRIKGDTYLPEIDWNDWQLVDSEPGKADDKNDCDYVFGTYHRSES